MRRTGGFTLVEIAVVIVIAAFMIAIFAALSSGLLAQQRRQATINRLAAIDAGLVQYVQQQKRLPCPANGTLDGGAAGAGTEVNRDTAAGCTDETAGVVPWTALGLPESEILDGWGRRITYRVTAILAADNRMDMAKCDPAGTSALVGGVCNGACTGADLATCTPPTTYLSTKGLMIQNVAGTALTSTGTPNTAAAYVLISAGESGGGAYMNTGVLSATTTTDGTEEQKNYANLGLQAYYVDDQTSDVAGAAHFDDILLRATILSVVTRAGLGPRSH